MGITILCESGLMNKKLSIAISFAVIGLLAIGCGSGKKTGYYCAVENELPGEHCEGLYVNYEKNKIKWIFEDVQFDLGQIKEEFGSVCGADKVLDTTDVYCIGPGPDDKWFLYQAKGDILGDEAAHKAKLSESTREVKYQESLE